MIVYANCDESGKFRDPNQPVVSFGTVVGNFQQVRRFEEEWKYCLREAGLAYLTMKEALNLTQPLSETIPAFGENSRVVALLPFVDCLKKTMDRLIGLSIDVSAFASLSSEAQKQLGKNPQYAAFTRSVQEVLAGVEQAGGEHVSIVCDDEEEVALGIYKLYRKVKLYYPLANKRLASLSLADDQIFCPIQGADLLASLMRLEARKFFLGEEYWPRFLYERLVSKLEIRPQAEVLTGFFGQQQLGSLSDDYVEFEKKYGRYGIAPLVEEKRV